MMPRPVAISNRRGWDGLKILRYSNACSPFPAARHARQPACLYGSQRRDTPRADFWTGALGHLSIGAGQNSLAGLDRTAGPSTADQFGYPSGVPDAVNAQTELAGDSQCRGVEPKQRSRAAQVSNDAVDLRSFVADEPS